jgi:hypothetical protein
MIKRVVLSVVICVVVIFVLQVVGRRVFPEWHVDFANTAWGTIIAAVISSGFGVALKGAIDLELQLAVEAERARFQKELAGVQGDVQQRVQIAVETERSKLQADLATVQGDVQQRVQTAVEAERARFQKELAAVQGDVQQRVQTAVETERANLQKELAAVQGDVQQRVQTALEAERARFQDSLTTLKATLDDRNSASAARRHYQYEARKRLYDEVEPLLFQVYEALEEAHHRVKSLARTARNGDLGWLARPGYYLNSTVYKLLLPVAHLRLMQRRMTFVDLGLDPHIERRYLLLKLYARSLTDDFSFAQASPELSYDPNHADWRQRRKELPAVYAQQGLMVGDLECVADLFINQEGEKSRAMSYGEFDGLLNKVEIDRSLQEAFLLFQGFSPRARPVLARMLVAQACLSRLILSIYHADDATGSLRQCYDQVVDDALVKEVSWGQDHEDGIKVAADYWGSKLDTLDTEMSVRRKRMAT